jgi:hypothetical protein
MKNLLLVLLAIIMAIPTFQSCKKGENDPAISFRSRDARLIGSWKMVKLYGTRDRVENGNHTYSTFTYDGNTFLDDMNTGSVGGTGTYEMIIGKNGIMSWNETLLIGNQTQINKGNGNWKWLNTDKNKTVVNLAGGVHLFESGDYTIDRLAYKELILVQKYDTDNDGDTYARDYTLTFKRQ